MVDYSMNSGNYSYSVNGRIFSNWKRPTRAELNAASQRLSDSQHVDPKDEECRNNGTSRAANRPMGKVHGDSTYGKMQDF